MVTLDNGATDVPSAVLNADRFVEMPEAEQQRLLAQLVEAGKVDIPKEICDSLRAINEERPRLASVGDVEAAHKRFYELRTEASRTLKALGHMEKPDVPSVLKCWLDPNSLGNERQSFLLGWQGIQHLPWSVPPSGQHLHPRRPLIQFFVPNAYLASAESSCSRVG